MNEDLIRKKKKNIITIGRLLWEKDLASGLNGNISARLDESTILITATGTCLGLLQEKDILTMRLDGQLLEDGKVSTEKLLHTEIYKNFAETQAVVHTHTTYTNAYFLSHETLKPRVFETRVYLGEVTGVPQKTPAVTDAQPVIDALETNNIAALRNHGVVAMGKEHFDCFLLIQALEDAAKIDAINHIYTSAGSSASASSAADASSSDDSAANGKRYKLFSPEQMDAIVEYVNKDEEMQQLGKETQMTFDLAVLLDETGESYSFEFQEGRIANVRQDAKAEFVVSAPEKVWRQVFNQEIDPFVATTQKKMSLDGDFAKISRWYAPCSRVFEIWAKVPIE